jgi:hypothetical protein
MLKTLPLVPLLLLKTPSAFWSWTSKHCSRRGGGLPGSGEQRAEGVLRRRQRGPGAYRFYICARGGGSLLDPFFVGAMMDR